MSQLSIREGPPLRFILNDYKTDFENNIIGIYTGKVEDGMLDFEVPIATDDIFFSGGANPVHFASAYQAWIHRDRDYFKNETSGMNQEEQFAYAIKVTQQFEMNIDPRFDEWMYNDILSVLDYHRMCFADVEVSYGIGRNQGIIYRNMPIRQVW
jgi:hypothetical protein